MTSPPKQLGKRERNRLERIQSLKTAGLELFLAHGIGPVTIDDLAKASGMAKGNFYRYYADKAALVKDLLRPAAREIRLAMRRCAVQVGRAEDPPGLLAAYAALAVGVAQVGFTQPGAARLFLQENRTPTTPSTRSIRNLTDELEVGAVHLTQVAVDHALLKVSDPKVSALAVVGAAEHLVLAVLRDKLEADPMEIGKIVVGMVMHGIGTQQRP